MSDQHHMTRQSDEEEEDLEILRLAALKSLHCKKDSSSSTAPFHCSTAQQRNIQSSAPAYGLGLLPAGTPYVNSDNLKGCYYVPEHSMPTNLVDNYDTRQRLEKLDINEPYVPQHIAPINSGGSAITGTNGWVPEPSAINNGYVPYIPRKTVESVGIGVSNVQLSPRSLAFVAENNDILMRRKGETTSPSYIRSPCRTPCVSPSYRPPTISYRSPSPVYRSSPGRWSITPPPKSSSRSPPPRIRPHHYSHRRSMSRSLPPSRGRSPINRRRTMSRSPPPLLPSSRHASPYRYSPRSPKYPNYKRIKSRSPLRPRNKTPLRRVSRSPVPPSRHSAKSKSPLNITGRRRSSPASRHFNKIRASPVHQKRSSSHGHDATESRHSHRPRSPQNHVSSMTRSRSRSPIRKFSRRSRDRNIALTQPVRRRSPYNNGRRRLEGSANGYNRNRGRKRSGSPIPQSRRKFSRSKSPDKGRRDENRSKHIEKISKNFDENQRLTKGEEKARNVDNNSKAHLANGSQARELRRIEEEKQSGESKKMEVAENSFEISAEDSRDKLGSAGSDSEKKQNMSSDEVNAGDSSDESDDDGIDLFPSDESESENEGRFKLCTSKRERDESVPTPSFTKLGESSVSGLVKDLKDVGSSSSSKNTNSGKEDRDKVRCNYESKRRDDRFRKSDGRNGRNDRRRINNNTNRREYEESGRSDEKRRTENPMFKSTFQAIDIDGKTSGKNVDEKDLNEKKKSVPVTKRRLHVRDERNSPENLAMSEKLPSIVTSNTVCNNGSGSTGVNGKKPIHLRLGAMTNTFKTPKKSSTWSSSSDKV